ncbi:MAG: hypothetical protein KAR42_06450 [candidate division Zixibacteria bacterium]|nr:hypothetical protein [candidate division Zixibacteria bacterium]
MEDFEPAQKIEIELVRPKFILGEPIPLKITYTNISQATISFEQPDKSRSTYLNIVHLEGDSQQMRLGKVLTKRVDEETDRYVPEKVEEISLAPKQTYECEVDLSARFATILPPGNYTFQIQDNYDDDNPVFSNEVTATFNFTTESVPRLMNITGDISDEDFRRRWAADWLKQLKVDFRPQFAVADDPDSIKEGCLTATKVELDKFRSWWATSQHIEKTRMMIHSINDSCFLIKEEENEDENE